LRLVQPKFFLPVHGEYNHIAKHAQTAVSCGVDERNILLMSDGDQIEITPKYVKKVKTVKTGKRYIDNQNNNDGLVANRELRNFEKSISEIVTQHLNATNIEKSGNNKVIEEDIRNIVRKFIIKKYKSYPFIIPTVFLV